MQVASNTEPSLRSVAVDARGRTAGELEQAVIGTMLASPDFSADVLSTDRHLTDEDFAVAEHRAAFTAISAMFRDGQNPTPAAVAAAIGSHDIGELPAVEYLRRLMTASAAGLGTLNFGDDSRALMDHARRGRLLELAQRMVADALKPPVELSTQDIVSAAETDLFRLDAQHRSTPFVTIAEAAQRALRAAEDAHKRGGGLVGLGTGIASLDRALGGLAPSDLVVLAGRPAMGKSALAMNIAHSVALNGSGVGVFSMEMAAEQLALRLIAERAGLSASKLRRGKFEYTEFDLASARAKQLSVLPMLIDASGGLTLASLAMRARRMTRKQPLGLIVIDYLQLMQGSGRRRGDNRVNEITEITMGLKALAKDMGVPILCLSQLSRDLERRDNKRPIMADLRDSGSIEQDADVVMFVHREEYYHERAEPPETDGEAHVAWQQRRETIQGRAEIIIGKARHGATATVDLRFDAETTSFRDAHENQEAV